MTQQEYFNDSNTGALYTKLRYEIRFKDIDPDSGDISQDLHVCFASHEGTANYILDLINKNNEEPNRDYYITKKTFWED